MSIPSVLLPLFVQVALTFALLSWTARVRFAAVKRGDVRARDIALREPNWPKLETQIANAYQNQLEAPMLFYALTILAIVTRHADLGFVIMAWLFVVSRLVHAYIHLTSNHVGNRFAAFATGVLILLVMWVIFAVRILLGL